MNTINPQNTPVGVQRIDTRGGERTDAKSNPAEPDGKVLPQEATIVSNTQGTGPRNQLADAVAKLNDYVQSVQRDLEFTLDESTGTSIITVRDRRSAEVIRQIPSEITLQLAQKLNNEEPLLLFSAQV